MQFNLKKANRFLPHILLIGIGIGSANYIMLDNLNWIQSVVQSISTSLIIGYPLVSIAANRSLLEHRIKPSWKLYLSISLIFILFGAVAIEMENIIRASIFSNGVYQPFTAGKMYGFNGIIALVLGFSFFQNNHFFPKEDTELESTPKESAKTSKPTTKTLEPASPIMKIPVKQGEAITLIPTEEIVYIEAFDNYAFIYDLNGKKRLCDYSLLFLQTRLDDSFLRIHRKYIVNTTHIKQIKPDANTRFLIHFEIPGLSPIVSSKSYASVIRSLIKIR